MMHHGVHVLTDELDGVLVPEQSQTRRIAKRTVTQHVYRIDCLCRGVQQDPYRFSALNPSLGCGGPPKSVFHYLVLLSWLVVCWLGSCGVVFELPIEGCLPNTEETCGGELISSVSRRACKI